MTFIESYLTKKTLFHLLLALPSIILLAIYGQSLNGQWWFYGVMYWVHIAVLVLNGIAIAVAPLPKCRLMYAVCRMLAHLMFIPAFCCLLFSVFFTILMLFGVDFNPLT